MLETVRKKARIIWQDKALRDRVLFVFGAFLIFRLLAAVPIPGVNILQVEQFFAQNQFLGLLNIFAGGGLSSLSLVMLGVGPFITAAIAMQLMTVMSPKLKSLYHDEGQAGRQKFTQYSRLLTVPLAVIQGFGFLQLLQGQGVIGNLSPFETLTNIVIITAGALLLTWVGELVTEYGIGNGVSLLIFAGIIAQLPSAVSQLLFTYDPSQLPTYLGFLIAAILIVLGVVLLNEAERPIPIMYSKHARGSSGRAGAATYLPLRVNQAGVMPIIFALSILLFPQIVLSIFAGDGGAGANITNALNWFYNELWLYGLAYFVLVFLFTFFYTAITFEPESVAENLQKSGAFVPGVRPGQSTTEYISHIASRITFIGGLALGVIAILPIIMQSITGIQSLTIGGTALLIVVAVVIDFMKRLDAQISLREY